MIFFRICFGLLSLAILLPNISLQAASSDLKPEIDPHSVIVKFRTDSTAQKFVVPPDQTVAEIIDYFSKLSTIEYVEPNYLVHTSVIPSDTNFSNQWYLKRIKAPSAWEINSKVPNIIIAVIDSGIQVYHPDLQPNMWVNPGEIKNNNKDDDRNGLVDDIYGWDFVNNFADPSPKFNKGFTEGGIIHGTVVAGIAAAAGNNNQGIAGITWQAKIMALKALDDQGNGDTAAVIKAIDYAILKGANIINLSFVGFSHSRALQDALVRARDAGVIVVAAAGNEQATHSGLNLDQTPLYPACYYDKDGKKLVVGVAATDAIDQKASFSGYGDRCIDIAAPGVGFYTTSVYAPDQSAAGKFFNQFYDGYWSGTSMAVPVISGTLALIQGTNPTLSRQDTIDILLNSSDDINKLNPNYVNQLGQGRVNVYKAIFETVLQLRNRRAHFAFAPATEGKSTISLTDNKGNIEKDFLAYRSSFTGGVNLATGDIDRDGNEEIITAPVKDLEADIRIFKADGTLISHFLAYPYSFKGGVNIAVADLDGDGRAEIITAPASGFSPEVKIFNREGQLIRSFLAYPPSFKGGVNIAVADVRDNANKEIITAPGKGGIPQIKIFSREGKFLNDFLVGSKKDIYGYRVAAADLDGNPRRRQAELIISRQSGEPLVFLYDFRGIRRQTIKPYTSPYTGDVRVMTADLNRNGFTDIITVPGSAGGPHVRIYNYQAKFTDSFYAYSQEFDKGLSAAVFLTY